MNASSNFGHLRLAVYNGWKRFGNPLTTNMFLVSGEQRAEMLLL
jgi:hypothetical protein